MVDEIQNSEQPNPEEITEAILSFNDPAIIINLFKQLGWSYNLEIQETVSLAKQNANLSIKFKAIKHLRELLREAAETSGLVANVSSTMPNPGGGHTTFHGKRIAGMLSPVKQIESTEIKEPENERPEEIENTEPDRGCDRRPSKDGADPSPDEIPIESGNNSTIPIPGTDTGRAFPVGDGKSGGTESPDGGTPPGQRSGGGLTGDDEENNPCIKTRPPTCNRDLFPGISTSAEE